MERKWASEMQAKGVNRVKALEAKISIKQEQYDVVKKFGFKDSAKELLKEIHELNHAKLKLIEEIDRNRAKASKQLLKCLCAADIATVYADRFAEMCEFISYGDLKKENNSPAKMLSDIAQKFNDFVCIIDHQGNKALSFFYSDMAEECIAEANKAIDGVIEKWMKTKKGQEYF